MKYRFACARPLYRKKLHPRVLCGPADLTRLRKLVTKGEAKTIFDAVHRRHDPVIERILASDNLAELLAFDRNGYYMSYHWTVELSLHGIGLLAALGDEKALAALRRILNDLPPATLQTLLSYSFILAYDLAADLLTTDEREKAITAILTQTDSLSRQFGRDFYKQAGGNIPMSQPVVAIIAALALAGDPGVPDLEPMLAEAIRRFEGSLHVAFNPDGFPEEDLGYGTAMAEHAGVVIEALRRAGRYDAYTQCPRVTRYGRAILHFVMPWGENLIMTGDHPPVVENREMILPRLATETRDPVLLWLHGTLSYGSRGFAEQHLVEYLSEAKIRPGFNAPATALSLLTLDDLHSARHPKAAKVPTHFRDRGRGAVTFRSGWNPDDTLLFFDASHRSPAAQGHAHASAGHFSLYALGEYFAIASGRYNNEQSCQNITLINGKSGRSTNGDWRSLEHGGNLLDFVPGGFVDYAAADSSHQHNCIWARRHTALVKGPHAPAYAITVDDLNHNNDMSEYWWTLNTSPGNTITPDEHGASIRGWRKGNVLDVRFVLPSNLDYPKPHTLELTQDINTHSSLKYLGHPFEDAKHYRRTSDFVNGIVYHRPRLIAKVRGYNGRFMSLMLPRTSDAAPARVTPLPTLCNALAARIDHGDMHDTVIWAYEHHLLEADDIVARGHWCVVRRNTKTGKVLAWNLHDGHEIKVNGKPLRRPKSKR